VVFGGQSPPYKKDPLIHVKYQEQESVFSLPKGELIDGELKSNKVESKTKHHNMILFGIVDWHTHHFGIVAGLFKKTKKLLTLILINVVLFRELCSPNGLSFFRD